MFEVPKRTSLIEQAAASLRHSIERGEWAKGLPAERALSDLLQVSRPTLREALRLLHREGWIRVLETDGRKIPVPRTTPSKPTRAKLVGFITSERFDDLTPSDMSHLYQLRRHLQDAGVRLEVVADARLKKKILQRVLSEMTGRIDAGCWVLHHATVGVQRWFADQQLPVIIMGSGHEGIRFPSLDWDHAAIGHHAATTFLSLGHRRIAILNPQSGLAGDQSREQSFLKLIQSSRGTDARAVSFRHDGSPEHIRRLVGAALHSPSPPTAIFASESTHALDVLTLLLHSGLRVPLDVSLIAGDREAFLAHVMPALACYQMNWDTYARRLSRLAGQLIQTGILPRRAVFLMPRFQRGESLAAPR